MSFLPASTHIVSASVAKILLPRCLRKRHLSSGLFRIVVRLITSLTVCPRTNVSFPVLRSSDNPVYVAALILRWRCSPIFRSSRIRLTSLAAVRPVALVDQGDHFAFAETRIYFRQCGDTGQAGALKPGLLCYEML